MKKFTIILLLVSFLMIIPVTVSAQQSGGELIIAVPASQEPGTMDGHIDPYQNTWLFNSFSADPLLILSPSGEYLPCLAESWEMAEDGFSWIFHLRNDVFFQDGTPFNAEALQKNFERVKAPETASVQMADELGPIAGYETPDEYTFIVKYDSPWPALLDGLRRLPIWSPTAFEKYGLADFEKHLIGTGPFIYKGAVAGDHISYERWEDYGGWNPIHDHEGPAYLEKVTIRYIGEQLVLGNMVDSGEAHIAQDIPATSCEDYENNEDATLLTGYQAGTGLQWVFNTLKAPLNQVEVRQALLYATDQDDINESVFDGRYLTQKGPLNKVHPCYWDGVEEMYPYDLDKANELLETAGWVYDGGAFRVAKGVEGVEDGTVLTFVFSALGEERARIGEILQLQWAPIGVDLKVEVIAGPIQIEKVQNKDFDLMYERQRTPDPRVLDMVWNSKNDYPGGWAWSGLKIPELDEALNKIAENSVLEERCAYAKAAQEIIMQNVGMLPTVSAPNFYAVSNSVHNFQLGSEGNWWFLNNTWIEE